MIKTNPYKINYQEILMTTFQVLQCYHISKVPIDLFSIVDQVPNLEVYRYSVLSHRSFTPIHEICGAFGSDFGTYAHNKTKNEHIIYYNDMIENLGLLRFTIAHEIAHFFLLHSKKIKDNVPYESIEREANFFARNLLAPMLLVDRFLDDYQFNSKNISIIVNCFNISFEAAKIRLKNCKKDKEITECLPEFTDFFNDFQIYHPTEHKMV